MPLSEAQKAIYEENRVALEVLVLAQLPANHPHYDQLCADADKALKTILEKLAQQSLLVNIDVGRTQLVNIILQAPRRDEAWLNEIFEHFVKVYHRLALSESSYSRALHARHAGPPLGARTWGNDNHLSKVLRGHITDPEAVAGDGCYILPPVMLTGAAIAAEEEKKFPYRYLEKQIETVLQKPENKHATITLLTPVNTGQYHWMLVRVAIEAGVVTRARLMDSLAQTNLKESPAFAMLGKAIQPFSTATTTMAAEYSSVQRNGFSCMDYTIQTALREKYTDDNVPAELAVIRNEVRPVLLREAIIERLSETPSPKLNQRIITDEIKQLFSASIVSEEVLHQALKKHTRLQMDFDGHLAKTLTSLYRADEDAQDKELFDRARKMTYEHFQREFKLFTPAGSCEVEQECDSTPKLK